MAKKLISLQDFNSSERQSRYQNSYIPAKNGIACPKCGAELVDSCSNVVILTNPPQKEIYCLKCKYQGLRVC